MLLFLISFLLVFASSYFLTSIIAPKKSILGLIYLLLIAFAQLILTFEILSLFTAIKQFWVFGVNVLFFAISSYIWNKKSRPIWNLDCTDFKNRVNNSLKLDKSLMWLYVGFGVFIISAIFLNSIMPITNADADAYHVARSVFWVAQGSLNHFNVADIRNLCLPINSEILYSWVLLFVKRDIFLGFFSFAGFILAIVSLYNIMGYLGFCTRKRLWVIFILSSFPSVLVQASGTETDIIIAGLISASIFLFWYALKNNKVTPILMSSLAYAIAVGTKTPAIIVMPAVGLFMIGLCFHYKKFKPLGLFLGVGLLNFLIFSSYNYILNYIQFSDFMGSKSFMIVSKNYYGIKGMFANLIKYIFMFIDFTGFRWGDYIQSGVVNARTLILSSMHLATVPDGLYSSGHNVNRYLLEPLMGAGIIGIFVYLPCVLWSFIKPIFNFKSKKVRYIFGFASMFIINLLVISYLLAYMSYSVRFVMFFMVLSSPILVYSYLSKRNPLKYVIVFFAFFSLVFISTHLWARPLTKIIRILRTHHSITYLRETGRCKDYEVIPEFSSSSCVLRKQIKKMLTTDNRILVFMNTSDPIFYLKTLYFDGYELDFATLEDYNNIDFSKYNIIITPNKGQEATLIKHYEERKNDYKINGKKIIFSKKTIVPCIYLSNPTIQAPGHFEKYPFVVDCGMSKKFAEQNYLDLINVSGRIVLDSGKKKYDYYLIYRNKRLPVYYKKDK